MTVVLYALLAVLVAVVLFLLAARFLPAGEQIAPPLRDEPPWQLPHHRELVAEDVDEVRLPVALRGYRFAETDQLLDRLAGELRERDAEIARLQGIAPGARPVADDIAVADSGFAAADPADAGSGFAAADPADADSGVAAADSADADDDEPA